MADISPCAGIDGAFYQPADTFFPAQQGVALTYDDVTLATQYSEILPRDATTPISLNVEDSASLTKTVASLTSSSAPVPDHDEKSSPN